MSRFTEITVEQYKEIVRTAEGPAVVKVHASFCAPCKSMSPALEALAEQYPAVAFYALQADAVVDGVSQMVAVRSEGFSTVPALVGIRNKDSLKSVYTGMPALEQIRTWLGRLGEN